MAASDQNLLNDFLAGREQAFRQLSERHMNLVYGVALRNTGDPSIAEEVVQDVFILLSRKAVKLKQHSCIAGWLHKVSQNIARNARRKSIAHQKKLQRVAGEPSLTSRETAALDERLAEIDSAVATLPEKEREAILLRFFEDQDYREIAQQLAISEASARKRVSRGINRLHSGLGTKLLTGAALTCIAPSYLGKAVAASVATSVTASAVPLLTTSTLIIMTKSHIIVACSAIALIGSVGYFAFDQSSNETVFPTQPSSVRTAPSFTPSSGSRYQSDSKVNARIASLEAELLSAKAKLKAAEQDVAFIRDATPGLEDQVIVAFGKVEEIGRDVGNSFNECLVWCQRSPEHNGI